MGCFQGPRQEQCYESSLGRDRQNRRYLIRGYIWYRQYPRTLKRRQRTLFGTKCVGTGVLFATWRETGRLQRDSPGVNNSSATKPEPQGGIVPILGIHDQSSVARERVSKYSRGFVFGGFAHPRTSHTTLKGARVGALKEPTT